METDEEKQLEKENEKLNIEIQNLEEIKNEKLRKIEKSKEYFKILLIQYNNITKSLQIKQNQNESQIRTSPTKVRKIKNCEFSSKNESKVISSLNSNITNVIYEYSKISNNMNDSRMTKNEIEKKNVYMKRFLKKKESGGYDKKKSLIKSQFEQNQNLLKNSLLTKIKEKVDSEYN